MVLQQRSTARIWGWAAAGATIQVTPSWPGAGAATATADAQGRWLTRLSTPAAGGPFTLTITDGHETRAVEDVLVGEVWICGGQSNMEWPLRAGVIEGDSARAAAHHPRMRLFDIPHTDAPGPRTDCAAEWGACTPESVDAFSAVGYFFGRRLLTELDVPIGLIGANWGGSAAEAWMSAASLRALGGYDDILDQLDLASRDPDTAAAEGLRRVEAWWDRLAEVDGGITSGFHEDALDDATWKTTSTPGPWKSDDLAAFDGIVWLRFAFDAPPAWHAAPLTLQLGPIDDMDTTWLNGIAVGRTHEADQWRTPRQYEVPAGVVRAGRNVVAIRVVDLAGGGGLYDPTQKMRIYPVGRAGDAVSLAGDWRYQIGPSIAELVPLPWRRSSPMSTPTVMFNGMIAPLTNYAIRGAIWYQGESNRNRADEYERVFSALIEDWRRQWGIAFPFYFVQIAPYGYAGDLGEIATLRDGQRRVMRLPQTGMVVTLDVGDPEDIHPRHKLVVGERLARWALAHDYGREDIVYSGPLPVDMERDGATLRVRFDHTDGGLQARAPLLGFEIAGADGVFVPARATIDGASLLLCAESVPEPLAVRYAWGAADAGTLFNGAGLPAGTFRLRLGQ